MIAMITEEIRGCWRRFRETCGVGHDRFEVVAFGDTPPMQDALAELVVTGRKRATTGLRRDYVDEGQSVPVPGDFFIVVDGQGRPRCVCKTMEVRIGPLASVDDQFACDEGEGDRSRDYWLREHRAFFGRMADAGGFTFTDTIETVFERFVLVWLADRGDGAPRPQGAGESGSISH